jgi:hypothetical protein
VMVSLTWPSVAASMAIATDLGPQSRLPVVLPGTGVPLLSCVCSLGW